MSVDDNSFHHLDIHTSFFLKFFDDLLNINIYNVKNDTLKCKSFAWKLCYFFQYSVFHTRFYILYYKKQELI